MQNAKTIRKTMLALTVFVFSFEIARAQSDIDAKTRDLLIEKFSGVNLNLAPKDPAKTAITLRLADLYAERARLQSMDELKNGCASCNAGRADRLKALALYREALPKVPPSAFGKVLTQIGHLYEMTGNEREAAAAYERIVKDSPSRDAVAEAHLSLGEIEFKRGDYARARDHFKAVVETPSAASRGLAAYRIGWCDFNTGQIEAAVGDMTTLLRTPELLTRSANADVVQADVQFQEEVSRDLATFLSHRLRVSEKDAALLYDLSPGKAKLINVSYLANEAERLGQHQAAVSVWRFALAREPKAQGRLEISARLAQSEVELRQFAAAGQDFEQAIALSSRLAACESGECKELKARLRKIVLDWNRAENAAPEEGLLAAYQAYIRTFANEADMPNWAAKVAQTLKQYPLAVELYHKSAELSLGDSAGTEKKGPEDWRRAENSLLGAIEAAELAKDAELKTRAYEKYLALSREKTKTLEVRYQMARMIYDRGENTAAADALRTVALSPELQNKTGGPAGNGSNAKIRKQAADLSLDALVQLKDDRRIEMWSADYARVFGSGSAAEFAKISRQAVLTQSTQTAAAGDGGETGALEAAWTTLSRFDADAASNEEKIVYYKNRLILAEKLHRFREARDAAGSMLGLPDLGAEDREFALARQAWLAEMDLDFGTALAATEKQAQPNDRQKWLKLAMYAELASKDPRPYYGRFLKDSKDEEKNAAIAAQLVRDSQEPAREIEKNLGLLSKRPALLAALYLDAYARHPSPDLAKKSLASPAVAAASAGHVIARSLFLDDVAKMRAKISGHELDARNQKAMAQTLKARLAMLTELEKLTQRALASGDWTSQLVALDLLAKQSDRFYRNILSLPVPAGLSPEDEQRYLQLLSDQAAPHRTRATEVAQKVDEFWKNEKVLPDFEVALRAETGARRGLLLKEIAALEDAAPEVKKIELARLSEIPETKPETMTAIPAASVERARQAVRESPLDRSRLESLLALERRLGKPSMIAYLESRLLTLPAPAVEHQVDATVEPIAAEGIKK